MQKLRWHTAADFNAILIVKMFKIRQRRTAERLAWRRKNGNRRKKLRIENPKICARKAFVNRNMWVHISRCTFRIFASTQHEHCWDRFGKGQKISGIPFYYYASENWEAAASVWEKLHTIAQRSQNMCRESGIMLLAWHRNCAKIAPAFRLCVGDRLCMHGCMNNCKQLPQSLPRTATTTPCATRYVRISTTYRNKFTEKLCRKEKGEEKIVKNLQL